MYNSKRNFQKTKEPKGIIKKSSNKKLKFVVQHHMARKDHYDLRLEWNGVYVSFAIPKGPSLNPKDKRLAIKVEDHPLQYGTFEDNIPKGEYGAGTVMLWDKGYWEFKDKKPNFAKGPIKFVLHGTRLRGLWTILKYKDNNWLLIKENDIFATGDPIDKFKTSIKTGRTMEEIKNEDIEITNPEKIIFKKPKITKKDIANYYKKVSDRMMTFLENRLISTVRCPNGIDKEKFYMKHLNANNTNIGKKIIKSNNDKRNDYYYIKNKAGLLKEVQMNSYEFHIWGSKQNNINKPDLLVFDLDPDENLDIRKVRTCVKELKKILDKLNLKSYLKTSGGKGYHIYVPLTTNSWQMTEKIARDISTLLCKNSNNLYTINMRMAKRKGKIFIDYFRNQKGSTSVCPYSLRLKKNASISCPIFWSELDKIKPNEITIKNIDKRLKKKDPWANFFD